MMYLQCEDLNGYVSKTKIQAITLKGSLKRVHVGDRESVVKCNQCDSREFVEGDYINEFQCNQCGSEFFIEPEG